MASVGITSSISFKCSLIAQFVSIKECLKTFTVQKWDPRYLIMTCHWFLGSLWFYLASHQLSVRTQFYCVKFSLPDSLNHSCLIIPNKDHLSHMRFCNEAIIPYLSHVDHAVRCGIDVSVLSRDLKDFPVNSNVFPMCLLTSANITVISRERLPDLARRSWFDMCQPLVLVLIFLFGSTLLCWIFHVVYVFDLEPLMVDCKYKTNVFSVAVRVSVWHLCDGFVHQFLCVEEAPAFLVWGSEGSVSVTLCAPLGKTIFSVCYYEEDSQRPVQIWVLLNINKS